MPPTHSVGCLRDQSVSQFVSAEGFQVACFRSVALLASLCCESDPERYQVALVRQRSWRPVLLKQHGHLAQKGVCMLSFDSLALRSSSSLACNYCLGGLQLACFRLLV